MPVPNWLQSFLNTVVQNSRSMASAAGYTRPSAQNKPYSSYLPYVSSPGTSARTSGYQRYGSPSRAYSYPTAPVLSGYSQNRRAKSGSQKSTYTSALGNFVQANLPRPKVGLSSRGPIVSSAPDVAGAGGDTSGSGGYYGGGGGGYYGGGGGVGGGGSDAPAEVTWSSFDAGVQGSPAWWKAMKPSEMNQDSEYLATLNLMIPFLSPEDQKTVASTIYQMDAKNFGHLNPEGIKVNPENPISDQTEQQFTAADRARRALAAMTSLAGAVGKKDSELGPGYRYLRSIIDVANNYGTQNAVDHQTRAQYQQMLSALDPLLAESSGTTGTLAPYGSLVKMLSQPFFSMGQLRPVQKAASGKYVFGNPNSALM